MRKRLLWMIVASAIAALPFPFLLILLFGLFGGSLMTIYFAYPVLCIVMGVLSGLRVQRLWFFPAIPVALAAPMVYFQSGYQVLVTLQMLGCYVLLGVIPMGITASVRFLLNSRKGS